MVWWREFWREGEEVSRLRTRLGRPGADRAQIQRFGGQPCSISVREKDAASAARYFMGTDLTC
jgi:hypothetical protein